MLLELQISDFAIIDRLHLRLGEGFNVLTGETGAGKSIIIDALGTLRGEKADVSFVRTGCPRARIEGVFSLDDCPTLIPLLREYDLLEDDDGQVILTREISAESGRSVARINRRAVNTSLLREIGGQLIDIHGQHEGQSLFNVRTHLDLLDRFGELLPLRAKVSEQVVRLRHIRDELADLRRNEARRQQRIEELSFLLEDVSAAQPKPNEEAELARERQVVQHATRITGLAADAYADLYGGREEGRGPVRPVVELMAAVANALEELARLDPAAQTLATTANELHYQLDDLATSLRDYRLALDVEEGRIDTIEDRLTVLRELQRKYGGNLQQLLERAANAEHEIERLSNSAVHIADLERQEATVLEVLGTLAGELSQRRREIGDQLARQIEDAMGDLAMPNVRFHVRMNQSPDPLGPPVLNADGARLACDKHGIDQVEFMIAPNPGEPLKPLAKVASGGESARLLLALKSILARVDEVATLIFDEIDVGVGGRAGQVVGQKLWTITTSHQVICITHLPQVAAFADAHYHISKLVEAERTRTSIKRLDENQRISELAAMLDGTPSEHSKANAREIIERALAWKNRGTEEQRNRGTEEQRNRRTEER
ncbi:DNA repair protein RecN [Candidatus Viridilinea mediisalina]|uniref:DNA repair protein RecN n=1 Tax=Candidatus Viridilinea mediisalina TaxID=2024553 RepID=A0A2A6RPI4_9CHLR|nr:DNA repair protein RecN [Candidatus Viridilinea mediisalina]PDW05004.1 DNA repair protein RecN [Candidatus Viridilinea mediisalina]